MLDTANRQLIEVNEVLSKCRVSGSVCALEQIINTSFELDTPGEIDIINISTLIPGPPGPQGLIGLTGAGWTPELEQRLLALESAVSELMEHMLSARHRYAGDRLINKDEDVTYYRT